MLDYSCLPLHVRKWRNNFSLDPGFPHNSQITLLPSPTHDRKWELDQDQDGNSEDIIMLENDKRKHHHHMKTASTAKDGGRGHGRMVSRVLRTENAAVDDDLDLFEEERTPE